MESIPSKIGALLGFVTLFVFFENKNKKLDFNAAMTLNIILGICLTYWSPSETFISH